MDSTTSKTITTPSPAVTAVESILRYQFKDKSLLEAALTHSSYTNSESYQRLEFVGDAALNLAIANFVFVTYPDLDPGQLSTIRSANISTEKFARVAVRRGLYTHMRHCAPALDLKVKEFSSSIKEEGDEIFAYGGRVKAPKVLADLVESVAAAVYVDCNFNLKLMWEYISPLLEPFVTLENIQTQPVRMIYELCQKMGKVVNFQHSKKASKNVCSCIVDGRLVSQDFSDQKDIAKLNAAKEALLKMNMTGTSTPSMDNDGPLVITEEIEGAKQKLNEYCDKRRWPKPAYRIVKEVGPPHEKKFISSVQIETISGIYLKSGELKGRVKDAENSAASIMIHELNDTTVPLI